MDEINTEINNLITADDKMNIQFNQDIHNCLKVMYKM